MIFEAIFLYLIESVLKLILGIFKLGKDLFLYIRELFFS